MANLDARRDSAAWSDGEHAEEAVSMLCRANKPPDVPATAGVPFVRTSASGLSLAVGNGLLSLYLVGLASVAVTLLPADDPFGGDLSWLHICSGARIYMWCYILQSYEGFLSLVLLAYECSCAHSPSFKLTLHGLACSVVGCATMVVQVVHKTAPRTAGSSVYREPRFQPPWVARLTYPGIVISHEGLHTWAEWITLCVVFGGQVTLVVFSLTLSALRWSGGEYRRSVHDRIALLDPCMLLLHVAQLVATCLHEVAHLQPIQSAALAHMIFFYVLLCALLAIPSLLWVLAAGWVRHLRQPDGPRLLNPPMLLFGAAQVAILTCVAVVPVKCQEAFVLPASAVLGLLVFPTAILVGCLSGGP